MRIFSKQQCEIAMSDFFAEQPTPSLTEEASATQPANPFLTAAYAAAMTELGYRPYLFGMRRNGVLIAACFAFLRAGRFSRSLEITSVPAVPHSSRDDFERGLREFCERHYVTNVEVNSFASREPYMPRLASMMSDRARSEYVVDLRESCEKNLSSNHARNVRRARNGGVTVIRTASATAYEVHLGLVMASLDRRSRRGELTAGGDLPRRIDALLRSGAGEFFQASRNGEVLSSIFVLAAACGAYYQSAGTSAEGMTIGASHLLICEIARNLVDRGMEVFNLGGADASNLGLQRFKSGFGSRRIDLPSAVFGTANPIVRGVRVARRWFAELAAQ
jgi:Acetyltransferase (GNAT) domain